MASISNLGAGTSLDLNTLYTQLETAEQSKLTIITNQQSTYNAQLSAWGKLQSSLQSLQTATAALGKTDTWNSASVTSTNTSFTATTTSGAPIGSYTVNVSKIAKAQVLTTASMASGSTQLGETTGGTRTITITQPGTKDPLKVELSDSDTSLNGIAKAINKAGGNVTASVIKATDGDYRLMLTSKSTGTDGDMTVTVTGDDTLQNAIGFDSTTKTGALNIQSASQNAKLTVNNIDIERQSNTIMDVLPGITLSLKSESTAEETLEVSRATDANKKAITDWVTAYNSLQSTINSLTKYVAVDAGTTQSSSNGPLIGDSQVRSVQSQLRGLLTEVQGSGAYKLMSQLGITQDPTIAADGTLGNLKIDDTKLTKALTDNPDAIQEYFIGDGKTTGFATQMNNTLTTMLSTTTGKEGIVQNAKDGINSTLKTLDKRYDDMQASIDATMARYKTQFTNLSTLVSKLTNTSNYLTQQFNSSS
ncbi:flagellar filament capping protein FliD [Trabulsiella odontotermitis]|uniref:Flagellar hook-associated protein 2 n=1 Tax=Trabulsiella odontotermitis TaxID=379893 RepID=A0A0L0H1I1_9ENTR|nr:flagellar filament capping protein FliD [Trabulsiella odontotermitis]KNC94806.1 flagellar cap protein FliD [Trabulsiella odontotermitis]